jgi:hypothetical protein
MVAKVDIYIGNLPASATMHDVRTACRKWDVKAVFERQSGIYKIGKPYQFFIARFGAGEEKEARRLIQQLKGISLQGRAIEVREYINRSYSHERRAIDWRTRPWSGVERRRHERRLSHAIAA